MLYVIGIGPGNPEYMTEEAKKVLAVCDLVVGYPLYLEFVKKIFPEKEYYATPMTREIERCRYALARAGTREVALVCSGDAGVYGMAGPVLELAPEYPEAEVRVVSGVTAALSGAAVLGAPLMHDFAVISLSDRLTPKEEICRKLKKAAESDFVIVLYNPSSKKRKDYLHMACEILLDCLAPSTVCGYVRNVGRQGSESGILSLGELSDFEADMFTTVYIGNSRTKAIGGRMVTPRGYGEKMKAGILVAAGTTEGRKLCEYFAVQGQTVYAFVATDYGEEMLPESPYLVVESGRKDADEMLEFLQTHEIRICYDAMHPYAVQAHKNMREACRRSGCAYTRVLREEDEESAAAEEADEKTGNSPVRVGSVREAAEYLKGQTGNIFVTTGSRELEPFAEIENYKERVWVRVLPSAESLEACRKADIPGKQIIAMHGPFSREMNELILREHNIRWLVTKESGKAGGFPEKTEAARAAGTKVILVTRPREETDAGISWKELSEQLEQGKENQ